MLEEDGMLQCNFDREQQLDKPLSRATPQSCDRVFYSITQTIYGCTNQLEIAAPPHLDRAVGPWEDL